MTSSIDLLIGQEGEWNPIFGSKMGPKGPKLLKIYISQIAFYLTQYTIILNPYFVNLWSSIDENWWIRKQGIDEICDGPKKSMLTVSMDFMCWCHVSKWMLVFFLTTLHTTNYTWSFLTNSSNFEKYTFFLCSPFVFLLFCKLM